MGRLPLVLLAYLCVENRPLSRDHLGALLWPKSDRTHQLQNLRQAVLRLRKSAGGDLLEGNGTITIHPGSVRFDHSEFLSAVERGNTSLALGMWKGAFLEGVRRPESWEFEDWMDRQRSKLENTLAASVVAESRMLLIGGDPQGALDLLGPARQCLPYHDEIGALQVVALASAGRVAEAEGVMRTVEVDPDDRLHAEMAEAISHAPETLVLPAEPAGAEMDGEKADGDLDPAPLQLTDSGENEHGTADVPAAEAPAPAPAGGVRVGHMSLAAVVVAVLLITASLMKGSSPSAVEIASAQDGFAILTCTTWAAAEGPIQPFRMGFDGLDKHRLSTERLCPGVWVDEAGSLFGPVADEDGVERLVQASPIPGNPFGEWEVTTVEATRHLSAPQLTQGSPAIAPGGVLLFSAEDPTGNRDVYALEALTGSLRRLTTSETADLMPSVDPGGTTVVFLSYRSGGGDLYRIEVDGTGLERLTHHPLQDSRPWVRGDTVLFVRGRGEDDEDGNMELFLLDLRDGSEVQLTRNTWNDYDPRWAPTGTHICWQSEKDGHFESDVEIMTLSTGEVVNVSDSPGRFADCHWTPDGQGIIYLGWRDGMNEEIFLAPREGGEALNLTRHRGEEGILGWIRLPEALRNRSGRDSSLDSPAFPLLR